MTPHQEHEKKLKERETQVVNVSKRTTKVNIVMTVCILIFFVAGAVVVVWIWRHPRQTTNSVNQEMRHP